MRKLSDMPTEILCQISRQLSTTDLGNLRLTNKRYEAAIFKPFMREFFSKKQFMFTEPSLQALIDISLHPQFGKEIKHLVLALDFFQSGFADFAQSEDQKVEYLMGLCAQRAFLSSGTARDMLATAVQNLPSLQVIDIRDFRSQTRTRDRGEFSSYGALTVEQSTGLELRMTPGHGADYFALSLPSTVFSTVVQVIGSQGIDIETVIRNHQWGLTDTAFSISEFNRARTIAALQRMKKLHLCLDMNRDSFTSHTAQDPTDVEARRWMAKSHLQTFLSYTTNLQWLRLNFPKSPDFNIHRSFLCWVGLPIQYGLTTFAAPLKRLDIGHVRLRSEDYLALFRKFKGTLEALSIWNSCIEMTTQDASDKVNKWGQLFKRLAELPHLREVVIGRIRTDWMGFIDIVANNGEKGGISVEYRGDDASGFLKRLAERTVPQWPASDSEPESDDSDGFVAGDDDASDGDADSEEE
ncbi:uncharacterized protein PgNI_09038 [Pyricularia grisea]|uniref:F-box domain-containing protein n=1 Tax=Pyricularia grisea TaxID=148305 RepID=A0A6P8AUR8_PYRGI|nr:uncharacterized protein PgNI_09038 [Pyricularia grisea]TLD05968.1 hypothetical protein PgNI_09038 [Pyricularia grisea]